MQEQKRPNGNGKVKLVLTKQFNMKKKQKKNMFTYSFIIFLSLPSSTNYHFLTCDVVILNRQAKINF